MPSTVPFTLDTSIPAAAANLLCYTNDTNDVVLVWTGLAPTDVVSQMVFTAKLNPSDADNAPTTVQKIATVASGLLTNPGPGVWQAVFPLTAADETTLLASHGYDIKGYGTLGGQPNQIRTIQNGTIQTTQGVTTLQTQPQPVASVALSPAALAMYIGDVTPLVISIKDANGNNVNGATVVWASSVPSVATVDQTGVVTAVLAGAATITATANGVSASATVVVAEALMGP